MPTLSEIRTLLGKEIRFQSIDGGEAVDQRGVLSEIITPSESDELQKMAFAGAMAMIVLARRDNDNVVFYVRDHDLLSEVS